jgi:hypothetical protein
MRFRPVVPALVGVLLVASCAPAVELPQSSGLGSSDLAPSIRPDPQAAATGQGAATKPKRHRSRPAEAASRPGKPSADTSRAPRRTPPPAAASATAEPAAAPVLSASVSDPSGDVQGSLTRAPDQVDVTGATLTRGTQGFTLRVSFAGTVPASDPDKTENVASFYDLDGDGQIDYEVWATLADNGWSGSYATPDGSRFGADSGVTARPDGRDLVVTFPLAHLRGARAFRWSVGAEWGSYEQLAAGATAKDNAPDTGVVAFPG